MSRAPSAAAAGRLAPGRRAISCGMTLAVSRDRPGRLPLPFALHVFSRRRRADRRRRPRHDRRGLPGRSRCRLGAPGSTGRRKERLRCGRAARLFTVSEACTRGSGRALWPLSRSHRCRARGARCRSSRPRGADESSARWPRWVFERARSSSLPAGSARTRTSRRCSRRYAELRAPRAAARARRAISTAIRISRRRPRFESGSPSSASGERVLLPGFVSDETLACLYAGATAVVLPSLAEGFGLPAVEAAACGAALVLSDLPAHRETLDGAAIFVAPSDAHAIARRSRVSVMTRTYVPLSGDAHGGRSQSCRGTRPPSGSAGYSTKRRR